LPRHRIITRKRNKLIIVVAAGTLTAATAASAAAAVWPSGSPATSAGTAFSAITVHSGRTAAAGNVPRVLAAQRVRAIVEQQTLTLLASRQAAHQAAVAQAAKQKAQAELAAKQVAARQAARQSAGQQAGAQQTPSQPAVPTAVPAASGSPQSVAQAILGSFGWSSSQFSCLQPLWAGESGWSVTASNPSTGAYGIPQAYPGSKMASAGPDWQTDAATQIRWGLTYIKNTYGSPCGAWSHEQADGWY
jgi:hypothetical protein